MRELAESIERWRVRGDRIALATYLNSDDAFPEAMVEFAEAYADQNERDYEAFLEAIRTGRLEAESGL